MLKKTITYTDYNDVERTETFYFNLTKAEIARIQLQENGNFIEYMQRLLEKQQFEELYVFFEDLVKKSYGEKSLDGGRFIKTPEKTQDFVWSPAFSQLIMEMVQDPDKLQEFMLGVIPKDMRSANGTLDIKAIPAT